MAIKHVGRMVKNKRKVIVAYRVVPNDTENAVVVTTENLMAEEHDALIKAVESDAGQSANEFAEVMARTRLPDGANMLARFHATGKMVKVSQADVEMTPDNHNTVNLADLNQLIASQKGITIADLAITDPSQSTEAKAAQAATKNENVVLEEIDLDAPQAVIEAAALAQDTVLTDEELAAKYRSDADRMSKEAAALRRQAEELVPTKKKTKKSG
jgi:hypothetical protein